MSLLTLLTQMQVGDNRCLLQSLKDSPYYRGFQDKVSYRSPALIIQTTLSKL